MDACTICLENLKDEEIKRLLDCNHFYHNNCIYEWSIRENSCPQCRVFFDFDTNNQNDFIHWMSIKLESINYCNKRKKLIKLVEMVNTSIRLSDKDIKCSENIYIKLLNILLEFENDLNYSWFSWLYNYDDNICEYGWYRKIIKKLEEIHHL